MEAGWLLEWSTRKHDWQIGSVYTLKGRSSKVWQIMSGKGTSQGIQCSLRDFIAADNITQTVAPVSRTCLRFGKQEKIKRGFGHFNVTYYRSFNGGVKFAIRPTRWIS